MSKSPTSHQLTISGLADIQQRSIAANELVVTFPDAMRALDLFQQQNVMVLGWEGWLRYPQGTVGHSRQHQGTIDLSAMSPQDAIATVRATIMLAQSEWHATPEVAGAELYFCITTSDAAAQ